MSAGCWSLRALALVAFIACEWVAHFALAGEQAAVGRLPLVLLPILAVALFAMSWTGKRRAWLLVMIAAIAVTGLLMQYGQLGLALEYGASHAAIYVFLAFLFGRTLIRGRVPFITLLARKVHGTLPPQMEAYTRSATLAWCIFFSGQLATSAALLTFAPLGFWSFFINLLNVPLLAAMFVGEYLYRVGIHPEFPHASIAMAIESFVKEGANMRGARSR